MTYAYGATDGRLATVTSPAGAFSYLYTPDSSQLASKENKVGATTISRYSNTVNSLGQRTGLTTAFDLGGFNYSNPGATNWSYDSLGQLVSAAAPGIDADCYFDYDNIGNRLKSHIGTTVNSVTTTHHYDAQSRKFATTTGGTTTLYIYDGWNCIAEWSADLQSASLTKTRTWGLDLSGSMQGAGGVGGLLAEKQGSDHFYPIYDGNGNVSEYLATNGTVAAHFEYDPFGNAVISSGTSELFTYASSTKPIDFATGFYYYAYRYYDPVTGRWLSPDPIGERGGMNLYAYCYGNPLNLYDPLGQEGFWSWLQDHLVWGIQGEIGDGWGASAGFTDKILKCSPASVSGGIGPGKVGAGVGGGIGLQFGPGVEGTQLEMGLAGGYYWGGALTLSLALDGSRGWELTGLGGLGFGAGGALTIGKQTSKTSTPSKCP